MPGAPFEYSFMDETLQKIYSTELQLQQAAYTSTVLSLIIVLLGVLGLISLSIQKRTKEIGIRKVLGSSVSWHYFFIHERIFMGDIVLAQSSHARLAYIIMHNWLQGYAYRINITATAIYYFNYLFRIDNSIAYLHANNKSSDCKSCKEFENGIGNLKI